MDKETVNGLFGAATRFQAESMKARAASREKYRTEESNKENILRILIDGTLARMASHTTNIIENADEGISYQIGISTSFIRTHFIVGDMLLDGDLIEATVLLRKQLENLVRLYEIDKKPLAKVEGKTPKISGIMNKTVSRLYGHLSEVAHFTRGRVTELLHVIEDGDRHGPSLYPVYADRAHGCFDLSCLLTIHFLVWLVTNLTEWYPDQDFGDDRRIVDQIAMVAVDAGVIRVDTDNG